MTLSIITINYNNRDGLQKTIDSVLAQKWTNYEWIIIDGGSTDGSRELIERYQEHFAYWCSEPDKGVYNAMNKGIAQAKGKYINFMNSGDTFYDAETLKNVFQEERTVDIIYGDWLEEYYDRADLRGIPQNKLFSMLWSLNICHQAMFIKAKLLKEKGYDESMRYLTDWLRNTELVMDGCSSEHASHIICKYDMYGISNQKTDATKSKEYEMVMSLYPLNMQCVIRELDNYKNDKYVQITKELIEVNHVFANITKFSLRLLFLFRLLFKRFIR